MGAVKTVAFATFTHKGEVQMNTNAKIFYVLAFKNDSYETSTKFSVIGSNRSHDMTSPTK